jgi:hypothetical protein
MIAFVLVPVILLGVALSSLAADSFLDRNSHVQEAVPYGTSLEPPPPKKGDESAAEGRARGVPGPPTTGRPGHPAAPEAGDGSGARGGGEAR